ncbi:cation-translocating P-type ATPase [Candidatus Woesearchaeota archaeon]|nr:cation-translocating P-type ATPase [Candidatus Woesearchaeota archaeon]
MADYYNISASGAIKSLKSSENGLTKNEAKKRLEEFGYNELQKEKKLTAITIFLSQFKNALILLLIFAGFLSLFLGEKIESIAIFGIVLLNAILGFIQEYKAEKAIEALEKISAPTAKVLRDGKEQKIPAREVVPGDILLLEAGDIVPADSRLIELSSLKIDEASLTGESFPSKKVIEPFKLGISVADQENMAFMGTAVTYGKGKSVVTGIGMKTEFGKIATSLQTTKEVQTPLQIKFTRLAKQIGIVAVVLIIIVLVSGTLQGTLTFGKMLLFALALTVSTIPNSLPIIVTVGLSMGTKRLAKKNMLIKKLPAAESLGAATIICSDKTGTITKNQMTITEIFYDNQIIKVSGAGYEPKGNFYVDNKQINPKQLELFFRIGYLCNSSKLVKKEGKFEIIGDPTEGSLTVLGKKGNLEDENLQRNFSFIEELPFDSDRKRMSVIFKNKINKKTEAYAKGAPDLLLTVCDRILEKGRVRKLTKKDREKILKMNNSFAGKALRVLALAYKEVSDSKKYSIGNVEKNLVFVGLVGMIDPPRDEVKQAVKQCQEAGIRVMIITGDHALTTKAIAQQVGLFGEGDIVLTGDDVEKMSDAELEKKIEKVRIIARALPIQKSRIVDALQKKGHIVAMTGDGVNDAPALKKADIGIAMGITGTDVAKEVSKATLTDDNFATIVNAIEEGRNIYNKMIKSAKYLLSCNAGEITAVFMAIMLKFPLPLLPLQILLMNLLTDDFPALGLGFESSEEGIMKLPPRDPKEKPISLKIFLSIVIFGLIMGLGTLFMFIQYKEIDLSKAQTVAFTTLVMFQMFAVMSSRTLYPSLKHLNPFSNKWLLGAVCLSMIIQLTVIYWSPLQAIFGTVALSAIDWLKIIGISSLGFIMMEVSKFVMKPQNNKSVTIKKC